MEVTAAVSRSKKTAYADEDEREPDDEEEEEDEDGGSPSDNREGARRGRRGAGVPASGVRPLLLAATGAALMFMLDPKLGKRRRAIARDKVIKWGRRVPRWTRGKARAVRGPLQGAMHAVKQNAPWREAEAPQDQQQPGSHAATSTAQPADRTAAGARDPGR